MILILKGSYLADELVMNLQHTALLDLNAASHLKKKIFIAIIRRNASLGNFEGLLDVGKSMIKKILHRARTYMHVKVGHASGSKIGPQTILVKP